MTDNVNPPVKVYAPGLLSLLAGDVDAARLTPINLEGLTGISQSVTLDLAHPINASRISQFELTASPTSNPADGIQITVETATGQVQLWDRNQSVWISGTIGATGFLSSQDIVLDTSKMSLKSDGAFLTCVLPILFKKEFKELPVSVSTWVSGTPSKSFDGIGTWSSTRQDTTPPVITSTISPPMNTNGWTNSPTTVHWTVTDPETGVESTKGCEEVVVAEETSGQALTCKATNFAGLSSTQTVTIRLDQTLPVSSATSPTQPNALGWYKSDVPVTITAQDNPGGAGIHSLQFGSAGAESIASTSVPNPTQDIVFTAEGRSELTYQSLGRAGNQETSHQFLISLDKTPPVLTTSAQTADGKIYPSGTWTNQSVSVTFSCSDSLSGMATVSAPQQFDAEGVDQAVNGSCSDNAGNETTVGPLGINIDKTAPTTGVSATAKGLVYQFGTESNSPVTITLSSTDRPGGSGVMTTMYQIDGGVSTEYNEPFTITSNGPHRLDFYAQDRAGNQEARQTRAVEIEIPVSVPGDITGDGLLDVRDVIMLLKGIVGQTDFTESEKALADLNNDGKVNIFDGVLMFRRIVGFD